jgi:Trypsin-like peptidase domain
VAIRVALLLCILAHLPGGAWAVLGDRQKVPSKHASLIQLAQADGKKQPTLKIPGLRPPQIHPCMCCSWDEESACCKSCPEPDPGPDPERPHLPHLPPLGTRESAPVEKGTPSKPMSVRPALANCAVAPMSARLSPSDAMELRLHFEKPVFAQCASATIALMHERDAVMRNVSDEARRIAKQYVDSCLSEGAMIDSSDLTPIEVAEVKQNLMLLLIPGDNNVYCHGFRISNHVLTALHCMRDDDNRPRALVARTVDSPQGFETLEILPNDGGAVDPLRMPNRDYGLLRLQGRNPPKDDRGLDWLGEPVEPNRLIVMQSNIYVRNVLGLDGPVDLTATIRVEHNPACRLVMSSPDGYLLHACPTEHGTSGAPLFQRSADGRIRFVGVHTGPTYDLKSSPQLQACTKRGPNYGVRVPTAEIGAAIARDRN